MSVKKRVTIIFDTNSSRCLDDMDRAKEALSQITKTDIDQGSMKIKGFDIRIENLSGGK